MANCYKFTCLIDNIYIRVTRLSHVFRHAWSSLDCCDRMAPAEILIARQPKHCKRQHSKTNQNDLHRERGKQRKQQVATGSKQTFYKRTTTQVLAQASRQHPDSVIVPRRCITVVVLRPQFPKPNSSDNVVAFFVVFLIQKNPPCKLLPIVPDSTPLSDFGFAML